MTRQIAMPLFMGGLMGLIMPWMMHMQFDAGIWFALAHVALALPLLALAVFLPRVRAALRRHLDLRHGAIMAGAAVLGWGATCVFCLTIGGVHWT